MRLGERVFLEKCQELVFPRACDAMINQALKKYLPLLAPQPRGDQTAAEYNSNIRELLLEKADHGKGCEGLTQIVKGKPDNSCLVAFNNLPQAPAEIFKKGIFLRMLGSVEQIFALNWGKMRVGIIGKADAYAVAACHGEQTVCVQYRALIGIDILIGLPASEAAEVIGEITECAARPRVSRSKRFFKETEHPLEVGIQQRMLDMVSSQRTGEHGDAPRRLRWLGNRGKDQQEVVSAFRMLHLTSLR